MAELLIKLLVSGAFTLLLWAAAAFSGYQVSWLLAAAVALIVVFGGLLLLDRVRPRRRRAWRG